MLNLLDAETSLRDKLEQNLGVSTCIAKAADYNVVNLDNSTLKMLTGKDIPAFVRFDKDYPYGEKACIFPEVHKYFQSTWNAFPPLKTSRPKTLKVSEVSRVLGS